MRRLVSGISVVAAVALVAVVVTALVVSHNAKSTKTGNLNTSSSTQTWQALPHLTNTPGLPVIAPSNPQVVYEAQFSRANLPASVTLRRSDDDGATWQNLPLPAGITQVNFAGFFVSPLAAQNVFVEFNAPCATAQAQAGAQVSAYSSGADVCTSDYFSTNGGASWSHVQWPVHGSNTSQIRMGGFYTYSPLKAQGTCLYALLSVGSTGIESIFVTSTDGGATWKFADQSLAAAGNCVTDYAATPTSSTVFAIAARCNPGNADLNSYTSKNNPASPAAGGGGNQLWRSDNAGASWAAVGDFAGGNAGPDLHVSLNSAGQPVLYDDGFMPITITPSNDLYPSQVSSVTKVSTDGGKTWQAAPQVNGQYANSSILGITSDGSIIEACTDTVNSNKKHQLISQLFSWKTGDTAWHQLSGDFPGESQYVLAVSSEDSGHDTLWLVTSVGSAYSVQRFSL